MKTNVKILLADDHDVVRTGVRSMLETHQSWSVCAEADNGSDAVKLAAETQPDVAVVDLELGELDGLAVTRAIKQHHPETEVLIFTMHDEEYLIREGLAAGARAFILKAEGGRALMKAIECAIEHKPFLAPRASEILLHNFRISSQGNSDEPSVLTSREREILQLLALGKSNKEAARALGISVKTVETHRATIMRKLNLDSIAGLVRYAVRERVISA